MTRTAEDKRLSAIGTEQICSWCRTDSLKEIAYEWGPAGILGLLEALSIYVGCFFDETDEDEEEFDEESWDDEDLAPMTKVSTVQDNINKALSMLKTK